LAASGLDGEQPLARRRTLLTWVPWVSDLLVKAEQADHEIEPVARLRIAEFLGPLILLRGVLRAA
jgi:hypothetical protein